MREWFWEGRSKQDWGVLFTCTFQRLPNADVTVCNVFEFWCQGDKVSLELVHQHCSQHYDDLTSWKYNANFIFSCKMLISISFHLLYMHVCQGSYLPVCISNQLCACFLSVCLFVSLLDFCLCVPLLVLQPFFPNC